MSCNDNLIKSHISISCKGCGGCEIFYDSFHDEYFSGGCGLIIMSNNVCMVDVGDDVDCGVVRFLLFDE